MSFNLDPVWTTTLPIKIHLATVLPAFAIGTYQIFLSQKGAPFHRALGYAYLSLMSITAASTIFIHQVNPAGPFGFSLIHLFVPLTLWGVYNAIVGARTHNIPRHRGAMIGLYIGGLLIAGGLTFLPGRLMHEIFFS